MFWSPGGLWGTLGWLMILPVVMLLGLAWEFADKIWCRITHKRRRPTTWKNSESFDSWDPPSY